MEHLPNTPHRFIGLAPLMRMAFAGADLKPIAATLIAHASRDAEDANALMDLATILLLTGHRDLALSTQQEALQMQQRYHVPSRGAPALRLLTLMSSGDLMANTPVEFLLEESDVAHDMLYVGAGIPAIESLPEHDVLFVAIGQSDDNDALLRELDGVVRDWPRPVINLPSRIAELSRDRASRLLQQAPGVAMPVCTRVDRQIVADLGRNTAALNARYPASDYPIILRPVGSHAGQGLKKVTDADEIADYLNGVPGAEFYLSRFVDYRSADGLFRKYRIILIDGKPFISHMGISAHWMIHYLNAGMADSAGKRAEEARFMASFTTQFAVRHENAFKTIAQRVGLPYVGIDCAETRAGELLIFEIDSDMIVHAMDPTDLFPYKVEPMDRLFRAFRQMLARHLV